MVSPLASELQGGDQNSTATKREGLRVLSVELKVGSGVLSLAIPVLIVML